MDLKNNWAGYLDRSAEQIKENIKNRIKDIVPELYDTSDNNPQNIITDIFAGLTEMLNYYIDTYARESFIQSAQMYKSMVNLVSILDYRIKANFPPSADVTFTSNLPVPEDIFIPKGTIISNGNYQYITMEDAYILTGDQSVKIKTEQKVVYYLVNTGVKTNGLPNQIFEISNKYVEKSAKVYIQGELYTLVDSFYNQGPNDKSFIVDINENKVPYIKLGDGLNGYLPTSGNNIYLTYEETDGILGFSPKGTITTLVSTLDLPSGISLSVNNEESSTTGASIEDIEDIRKNAPLHVRTLNVAVTRSDIEDLAKSFPSIKHAILKNGCSTNHVLYASVEQLDSENKNTITKDLIDELEGFINPRIVFSNHVTVKPLQITNVKLSVDVYLKYMANPTTVDLNIREAINNKYGYNADRDNNNIFLSDLVYLIDDQEGVDHNNNLNLSISPVYLEDSDEFPLTVEVLSNDTILEYEITRANTYMVVTCNNKQKYIHYSSGDPAIYNDGYIKFTWDKPFNQSDPTRWLFRIYPNNTDLVLTNAIALPVIFTSELDNVILKLHKQFADGTWE